MRVADVPHTTLRDAVYKKVRYSKTMSFELSMCDNLADNDPSKTHQTLLTIMSKRIRLEREKRSAVDEEKTWNEAIDNSTMPAPGNRYCKGRSKSGNRKNKSKVQRAQGEGCPFE